MKRFTWIPFLFVAMLLAMTIVPSVALATAEQMISVDKMVATSPPTIKMIAVDSSISALVDSPALAQMMLEQNSMTVPTGAIALSHVDVTLKSMIMDSLVVGISASPPAQLVSSHIYSILMMEKSVVVEPTPIAKTQVTILKNPTMMLAGIGHSTILSARLSGIDMMVGAYAVLPNTAGIIFGETAFSRILMASVNTLPTQLVGAVAIKNDVVKMEKGSINAGSGASAIFST